LGENKYQWYVSKGGVMKNTAKIFVTGRSQAVRLPKAFRFDSDEVYIHRDLGTGHVILSEKPHDWDSLFAAMNQHGAADDFVLEREQQPLVDKALF